MRIRTLHLGLAAALAVGAFACREEGTAEKAGRKIDEAVENVREGGAEAVEKAGKAAEDVRKGGQEALEELGQKADEAIDETGEAADDLKDKATADE